MAKPTYTINQRELIAQISVSEPLLKGVMDEVVRDEFFLPAVEEMKQEFTKHPVTQEIVGGTDAANISNTLEGSFKSGKGKVTPNLYGFIGFDVPPFEALDPIAERLDPKDADGPKMKYVRRSRDKLEYEYQISAPDEEAIYNDKRTGFFWAPGLSWVKRIEQGIPGITHFLNEERPSSRSGGGIQVEGDLRSGRFRPVSYLSAIFNNFLRRSVNRKPTGRSI